MVPRTRKHDSLERCVGSARARRLELPAASALRRTLPLLFAPGRQRNVESSCYGSRHCRSVGSYLYVESESRIRGGSASSGHALEAKAKHHGFRSAAAV